MPVPICPRKDSEQGLILQGIKCQTAPSSHVQKKKKTPRLVITILEGTSSHTLLNGCSSGDLFILKCRHRSQISNGNTALPIAPDLKPYTPHINIIFGFCRFFFFTAYLLCGGIFWTESC